MNYIEFPSKTLILYSFKKNERIDLSCLPDEYFDTVLYALQESDMCVMGSPFTGKYIKEKIKADGFITRLNKFVAPKYPRINRLVTFVESLSEGDVFRVVSDDAPTMNKQLASMLAKVAGKECFEKVAYMDYMLTYGVLSTKYIHFAFGYDGLKYDIGERDKKKRVCRFCRSTITDTSFKDVAHAIPQGLGNTLLFCYEECKECNNKFSKTESNLMHYLDVRRAMGGILTKSDRKVPSVDGKNFVIRGDEDNKPILYIEKESLTGIDIEKPFLIKLETNTLVSHQGIYKSLCKIVLDLLPKSELHHFDETIGWIKGRVMDDVLPPYLASYERELVKQPTVDIFLSKKSGKEPYCTAMVHILDVLFLFILPEVDVDKGKYKSEDDVRNHFANFRNIRGGRWIIEDTSEYKLSYPWVLWNVIPGDPQIRILPKSDPIFNRYKRDLQEGEEEHFPLFSPDGVGDPEIADVVFNPNKSVTLTREDLKHVSVNFKHFYCILDKINSNISYVISLNFSDSSNRVSFFDYSFRAIVGLKQFDKYIKTCDYFCIDYHLRDYTLNKVIKASDQILHTFTQGTSFLPITMSGVNFNRVIRNMTYYLPIDDNHFLPVKDAEMHSGIY